jgi:glycosyltransferase involved in cell wall biosynthesis
MAHALPVVAFQVGGVPEWLENGSNGLAVPRGDTDAMAAAIDALLGDPSRARALGAAGLATVRTRLTRERHVDGLERLLESVRR